MHSDFRSVLSTLLLLTAAGLAAAQAIGTAPSAPLRAAAANVEVAKPASGPASMSRGDPMRYPSAFEGYRPFTEQPVGSWREANDVVARIGGWQAYAREGRGGPAGTDAKASVQQGASAGHAGMAMPSAASAPSKPSAPSPAASATSGDHSGHKMP